MATTKKTAAPKKTAAKTVKKAAPKKVTARSKTTKAPAKSKKAPAKSKEPAMPPVLAPTPSTEPIMPRFPKPRVEFHAVAMKMSTPPNEKQPGCFCQVLIPFDHIKVKVPIWVRVYEGDERNGKGVVHVTDPRVPEWETGHAMRYAGGTASSLPRMVERIVA